VLICRVGAGDDLRLAAGPTLGWGQATGRTGPACAWATARRRLSTRGPRCGGDTARPGVGGVGLVRVGLVAVAVALVASLAAGLSQHHGRGVVSVVVAPAVVLALMIGSVTGPSRLRVGRALR